MLDPLMVIANELRCQMERKKFPPSSSPSSISDNFATIILVLWVVLTIILFGGGLFEWGFHYIFLDIGLLFLGLSIMSIDLRDYKGVIFFLLSLIFFYYFFPCCPCAH